MTADNFDQFVKSFIKESNGKQYREKEKLAINIGSAKHDPTSPNVSHIEEDEQLDEVIGTGVPIGGGSYSPRRSFPKNSLAGKRYAERNERQRSGKQKRRPGMYEEARMKAMKKVAEKKNEMATGKTDTGKRSDFINVDPDTPGMTGYHR